MLEMWLICCKLYVGNVVNLTKFVANICDMLPVHLVHISWKCGQFLHHLILYSYFVLIGTLYPQMVQSI
uniref:Uncharacterized protein n=1 Tax=Arundo donax TaxID=35708 RepID=A0A0A9BMZ1_ARUDO